MSLTYNDVMKVKGVDPLNVAIVILMIVLFIWFIKSIIGG